jgi:hypothetical protein
MRAARTRGGIRRTIAGAAVSAAVAGAAMAAGLTAPAIAAQASQASQMLGAGQVGSRAEVPWAKVGPHWALALYSASHGGDGTPYKHGASTLYLVDPEGGRYSLESWSARSTGSQMILQAWSGDGSRALLYSMADTGSGATTGTITAVHQVQLRTGAITSFRLPENVSVVGYTRPDGLNVLAEKWASDGQSGKVTLLRYNLAGHLQKTLATGRDIGVVAYQPAGASIAVGTLRGLELVSNQGGVIRTLPVPGVREGCNAVRWWSASTILASCSPSGMSPEQRLWLVPASGARPTALTPTRTGPGFDLGDFDAWQLSSGLYVDGYGGCGTTVIGRQPAHGPEQQVSVPGAASPVIIDATRSALLVERNNGCASGSSLVWFNPATRAVTVVVPARHNQDGVVGAVPYFVAGKY